MNYGDPAQQQYYVQRMPQQAQRMAFTPQQQQQMQQPSAGMIVQQQQTRQTMVYPSPHQQQTMMRMPQHMYTQQQGMTTQQQQQQQFKNFLQNLPQNVQAQFNAEKDPDRKKQIFQMLQRQQQQQQQQMFEQQQQQHQQHMAMMVTSGGTVHNQPGPMAMRPMAAQRMPMVQTTNGATSIIFATTTTAQQSMPQQSGQNSNAHFQRIPSQSSFVTHSSSPTPMGTANYQQRAAQPQMFMAGQQQQMPGGGGGMQQIRAVTTTAQMPGSQQAQFVQQQQQMSQQQFLRQQQFEPVQSHMAAQQQQQTKTTDNNNSLINSYQAGAAIDGAASQNRMAPSAIVVKTENGLTNAAMASANVRTSAGGVDGVPSVDSNPPSVGAANRMASMGRLGSVQQQQQHQSGNTHQVDTDEPEYKALLKQLCKYHADVKRLLGRFELDTLPGVEMKIKASLVNVIQVMEGTRKGGPVTKTLLQKLLSNVQTVLERHHISRHLFSIAKKLTALAPPQNGASANGGGANPTMTATPKEEPFETDPWRNVRHLAIKLPDAVLNVLEDEKVTAEKQQKMVARGPATSPFESVGDTLCENGGKGATGRKRIRQKSGEKEEKEEEGPPSKKSLLERVAESFEATADKLEMASAEKEREKKSTHANADGGVAEGQQQKQHHFRISCLDGTEMVLNHNISEVLSKAIGMGFTVHTEGTDIEPPISRNAPAVQIRFEHHGSGKRARSEEIFLATTTATLNVLMPVTFPDAPLELFLHHHHHLASPQMEYLMEKIDAGTVDMYSLDALLSEWVNGIASFTCEDDTDGEGQ